MAVMRVHKKKNYTVMSNYHLKEKEMSLKAKGLLSVMLSLPDNWDYSIAGLVAICKENETAINSTLKELEKFGYLKRIKKMPSETKSGHIEYEYNVYEKPQDNQHVDNQAVEKQGLEKQGLEKQGLEKQGVENLGVDYLGVENQGVENQGQLNTNILNTNILNTNKENTNKNTYMCSSKSKSKRFIKPTIEEIAEYCAQNDLKIDCERFYDYYESNDWHVGKNKMKDWKAAARNWNRNNYSNSNNKNASNSPIYTDNNKVYEDDWFNDDISDL